MPCPCRGHGQTLMEGGREADIAVKMLAGFWDAGGPAWRAV